MKVIVIQFPDSSDITCMEKGKTASVTVDSINVDGGIVLNASSWYEQPPVLVPHTHIASIGSATPG